ncbi:hypothetical protein OAB80_00280 [Flavobacteriaceae bacterium]|nr:hypothetical protein [Flavobacteriaceae bacterium]
MSLDLPERFFVENQIYFDTSSINEIIKNSIEDCVATQNLWAKKERRICLSAVNLYEIFGTSNIQRREDIIHKMGIIYYGESGYLDMPTRILFGETLNYFTDELTPFEKSLRDSWFNVKRDPKNLTFNIDSEDFKARRKILKSLMKTFKFVLKDEFHKMDEKDIFELRNELDPVAYISSLAVKKIFNKFPKIKNEKKNEIKLILNYFIFCFGIEPQSDFLENYWSSVESDRNKVEGTLDRAFYLLNSFYDELLQSPIIDLMSEFILFEANHKGIERGTLSDSFHLIYSFYCFKFITDDQSIIDFSGTKKILDSRVLSVKTDFFIVETKS